MAIGTAPAVAQESAQTPAEWQRMFEMGLEHRSASDLYMALKEAAGGGQQMPPFGQLPDWSGLWTAAGGRSFFGRAPTGALPKLTVNQEDSSNRFRGVDPGGCRMAIPG